MVYGFWPILAQLNRHSLAYFIRLQSQAQFKAQILHYQAATAIRC